MSVSLATGVAGCKKATVNEGPEPPHADDGEQSDHTVNVAPTEDEPDDTSEDTSTPPDGPIVNTVPD